MSEIQQKQESASIQRSGFSGMSITAFILSLFGFLLAMPAVAGLILGIVSLARSNRDSRRRGLAIAAVVISVLWIAFFGVVFLAVGFSDSPEKSSSTQAQEQVQEADLGSPGEDAPSSPAAPSESSSSPNVSDLFMRMASKYFDDMDAASQLSACKVYLDSGAAVGVLNLTGAMTRPSRMATPLSTSERAELDRAMETVLNDTCR